MESTNNILSKDSIIFFVIFFGLILFAIGRAYYHVEVLQDFHVFSEGENIPRASDFYSKLFK
jgi:hypothetical protein